MEITRRFPSSLVYLLLCFYVTLSCDVKADERPPLSVNMQVMSAELPVSGSEYSKRILTDIAALAGYSDITFNMTSSTADVVSVVVRTPQNENDYYWITPLIALPCDDDVQTCSMSPSKDGLSMRLLYAAMSKNTDLQDSAEALSQVATTYKMSEAFKENKQSFDARSVKESVTFKFGILGLGVNLNADMSDLWVISDLVPLFSELTERGELKGIAADFVKDLLDDVGMSSTILFAPWLRIAKEAENKPNVLVFSIVKTPERDQIFHWISPISRNLHGIFGINGARYDDINAIEKDKYIGVLTNDYRYEAAKNAKLRVNSYNSWQEVVSALLDGEVDFIFASQGAIDFGCSGTEKQCKAVKLVAPYRTTTAYLALSKQDTSLLVVERLKLASAKIKQDTAFKQKLEEWSRSVYSQHQVVHHIEDGVVHLWEK
ncbi:substrate-binding periplasmic protein [Alteromonas sp. A079]|uniref:substrate-binding periplasmic protein n=1 Tax=Alteromonas sp. A079 TaxID=3410268 RepID=UPI003BA33A8A